MRSRRVILAGGSGFIGRSLARELAGAGYEVIVLTRSPEAHSGPGIGIGWDGRTSGQWVGLIDGAAAVVNLAGKSVNCRYTPENRREIIDSRVDSVRAIGRAIARSARPPRAWVQAGSLAIYGDAGDRICAEDAPAGDGFGAEVCRLWEDAFAAAAAPATRKVFLRIGLALGKEGSFLDPLVGLVRWFIGGAIGSGRQWVSWLHGADLDRMFRWAIEREDVAGIFNATGPEPATNADFMRALRRALGRPWSPPAPSWVVQIGARLLGTEPSLALTGRRGIPARFAALGFPFRFPRLDDALRDLFETGLDQRVGGEGESPAYNEASMQ